MTEGKRARLRSAALALAVAGALTLLAGLGALDRADYVVSDALYQNRRAHDGDIVLVEINQEAIEMLGPYEQWGRGVIAQTLETLNESEDCRPAAIALDILYTGETDPGLDNWLAEAARTYDNVITAAYVQFGTQLVTGEDGELRLDNAAILGDEEPYDELRDSTVQGDINVMLDEDGMMRHYLLQVTLPDGSVLPSLALAAAEMYRERMGQPPLELPETSSEGLWYLHFAGQPGDFDERISVWDVLSGEVPADYFADKIVFIGPYAPAFQDEYFTAIDHALTMYGVEIHANAAQVLLWGDYHREVDAPFQLALLFVILLAAFFGFWRRRMLPATVLWAALCGLWVLLCRLVYRQGWLFHALWVPVGVTILFVGCIAFNYVISAMEKRKVTNTFGRYVDPSVIQELLREGSDSLELGGKMTDIAVLFVDIRGFTTMSEVLSPSQVVEILNQYLSLTTKCVMDNHGTLDKFVGDCTMAFWNAPLPQEDYVMNACKAAMDMVKGSKPLAEKLEREFGRTVSFGVGVNVGPAVVGNIGASMRMDYTAIGDTVNTAARLEANAPAGTVYISRAVADALEGRVKATPLAEPIKLKGKADGFEILTLDEIL